MRLHSALGLALTQARGDDTAAISTLLSAVLDDLNVDEARVLVMVDGVVEVWSMAVGADLASFTVELGTSRPGGIDEWRTRAEQGDGLLLVADLPHAPGYDRALLVVETHGAAAEDVAVQLDDVAAMVAALIAAARAEVVTRQAEAAARHLRADDRSLLAQQAHKRALWATFALKKAVQSDDSWTEDAAAHLHALREITAQLAQPSAG